MANRSRYEAVSKQTSVPWDVIAVIHPMHGR
jgi:lysozyme family protein